MAANEPQARNSDHPVVNVSDWTACHNGGENVIVLSCNITAADSSASITGVGMLVNDSHGTTIASCYLGLSGGVETASPALNIQPGNLNVGDNVWAVAQGECEGSHFFFEQELTITEC